MVLMNLLRALLDAKGFDYTEHDDTIQMRMRADHRRWDAVFCADDEGFLRYYGRYPMRVPGDRTDAVLAVLNRLNTGLRAGCFLLSDGYPMFRYGAYIFDEYTAALSVADLVTVSMAETAAAWDAIEDAACGRQYRSGNE